MAITVASTNTPSSPTTSSKHTTARFHTPLPQEINTATRAVHTHLNRLITARIPLALPPHTDDPCLYWKGLNQFSKIYEAFEHCWADLLRADEVNLEEDDDLCVDGSGALACEFETETGAAKRGHVEPRILEVLSDLHDPELLRFSALNKDLWHLYNLGCDHTLSAIELVDTGRYSPNPELAATAKLVERIKHISQTKPHLLVAYFWIFYMALFSGGRWIRAQLQAAPPAFWSTPYELLVPSGSSSPTTVERYPPSHSRYIPMNRRIGGFSFLSFATEPDGLPTKSLFLEKLARHETSFTRAERDEIVEESVWIFEGCVGMIGALDDWLVGEEDATKVDLHDKANQEAPTRKSSPGNLVRSTVGKLSMSMDPTAVTPSPENQLLIRRTTVSFLGLAALWWASTRYFA